MNIRNKIRGGKMMKINDSNNSVEKKYYKNKIWVDRVSVILALTTLVFSIVVSISSKKAVEDIKKEYIVQVEGYENSISNIQDQYQILENQISNIQEQYVALENIINQQQTVDVIQARDNDVLIKTPDDKWLVIPMIEKSDITFANEIIEKKYKNGHPLLERIDMFNYDNEDWSARDGFTYTLPFLSLNQNKMVSLYQFITKIEIEFKLYNSNKVDYQSEFYELFNQTNEYKYLNVFENIMPNKQFITKEFIGLNGIEDIKLTVIITFNINDNIFAIPYTFDDFIYVNEDK